MSQRKATAAEYCTNGCADQGTEADCSNMYADSGRQNIVLTVVLTKVDQQVKRTCGMTEGQKQIAVTCTSMSLLPMLLLLGVAIVGTVQGQSVFETVRLCYVGVFLGRKYYVSDQWESFNLAKMNERCKNDLGGYLVQIDQWREQAVVTDFIFRSGWGPFFIGITDEKSEGKYYHYNDNTPPKDIKWKPFQPDNWYNEDCVEIWHDGLNDRRCGDSGRYLCEVPQ
ncbi:collectin-12 [Plakobranchus ocellatus]|uniref:Collectin-12 n=1 Tax=Plakobranchus ocellatus TaxID=259542 RepID=A0AAV3XWY8_9GAST|nr:collectin-12 [Plakobranchus ocellatus]